MRTKKIVLFLLLVIIASFVRFYRISDKTEFLGDQGRDGLDAMQFVRQHQIPPYGPPLSNGGVTGPFYYYLITPVFELSRFNPVVPAALMAGIGTVSVLLFFRLASSLFGFGLGWGISLLYALSPPLVTQDRNLWPPTIIPFFIVVVLFSMYEIYEKRRYWPLVSLTLANIILLELHWANGITACMSLVFTVFMVIRSIREKKGVRFIPWLFVSAAVSILAVYPFLKYESARGFGDILGSVGTFASGKGGAFSKRLYVSNIVKLIAMMGNYLLPVAAAVSSILIIPAVLIGSLWKKTALRMFLFIWFLFGICVLAAYKDNLQPQYAYQLTPVLFILTGFALFRLRTWLSGKWIYAIIIVLSAIMIIRSDIVKGGNRDIYRTRMLTDTMVRLSAKQPFSFTLINSRSFSDLHYRFYFALNKVSPAPIDSADYHRLFLVCESGQCPTVDEIHMNERVYSVCSDRVCKFNYPIIDIWTWKFVRLTGVESWVIYTYER